LGRHRESLGISNILRRIDGRGYRAYKALLGASERVSGIKVEVLKVQGDPYAPPSIVKLESTIKGPPWALRAPVPFADWIHRRLYEELKRLSRKVGDGYSGFLGVPKPSNIIIRRSTVELRGSRLTVRLWVGLPSRKRRILSEYAEELLLHRAPRALNNDSISDQPIFPLTGRLKIRSRVF